MQEEVGKVHRIQVELDHIKADHESHLVECTVASKSKDDALEEMQHNLVKLKHSLYRSKGEKNTLKRKRQELQARTVRS